MKAKLTVIHKNGFEEVHDVVVESSELIRFKKNENKKLYTGVHPRVHSQGPKQKKKTLMYYARFGYPFTFDPLTGDFFLDEKKRSILIENGLGYPLTIDGKRIIILLKQDRSGEPEWRQEVKEKYSELNLKSMEDLEKWLKKHPDLISEDKYVEIPAYCEYDVSKIDMAREENFQLIESGAIGATLKSMAGIGRGLENWVIFLIFASTIIIMMLVFFYFANDGVFNQGVTKEVVEKAPEQVRRALQSWRNH